VLKYLGYIFSIKFIWALRALFYKIKFGSFGNFSYMGKPLYILNPKRIFIGNYVRIFPHARIELYGNAKLIIKDNVSIGHNAHITCYEDLIIDSGTALAGNVTLMSLIHDVSIKDIPYMDQPLRGKKTNIGTNCLIGSNSVVLAGANIGNQCIVATNTTVSKNFEPYSIIAGNPGVVVKKLNFNQ